MADFALPVLIQTYVIEKNGTKIYVPQVIRHENLQVQNTINKRIIQLTNALIADQKKQQDVQTFQEMIGLYEIKTNERNVLSLSLSNYAYAAKHAHGLTLMKSLTFDTITGKEYQLQDLFKENSNFTEVLSRMVQEQIRQRNIQLINPFPGISENQDYYIADKSLVLYFQLYDITPYYLGFPMFPISVYDIQSIIKEDAPLNWMATSS